MCSTNKEIVMSDISDLFTFFICLLSDVPRNLIYFNAIKHRTIVCSKGSCPVVLVYMHTSR